MWYCRWLQWSHQISFRMEQRKPAMVPCQRNRKLPQMAYCYCQYCRNHLGTCSCVLNLLVYQTEETAQIRNWRFEADQTKIRFPELRSTWTVQRCKFCLHFNFFRLAVMLTKYLSYLYFPKGTSELWSLKRDFSGIWSRKASTTVFTFFQGIFPYEWIESPRSTASDRSNPEFIVHGSQYERLIHVPKALLI